MSEINFYNVDCVEFMKTKPDNYYDLAIVDPPYGIGASNTTNTQGKNRKKRIEPKYTKKDWDNERPNKDYWFELKRVSKNQIVFGANYFVDYLGITKGWIFWNKKNGCPSFSDGEFIYTSFDKVSKMYTLSSVVGCNGGIDRFHPTQKPVDLYRWILQNYAEKGMKVLDTHGGSMTNAIACDKEEFSLDICEIDLEYFKNGLQQYQQYKRQGVLF